MRLTEECRAHLVGITGAGLSSLAAYLSEGGTTVSGSDLRPGPAAGALRGLGIQVRAGHDAANVDFTGGVVVASAAIPAGNPELAEARRRGLRVLKFSDALGEIACERPTLAVAGTHGKTSTGGMLVHALRAAGQDPGYILGGTLMGESELGGRRGSDASFVVEACEYDRSFLRLSPWAAAILNVDPDHFDCYPEPQALLEAFRAFLEKIRPGGLAVLSEQASGLLGACESPLHRLLVVGEGPAADLRAVDVASRLGCFSFAVEERGRIAARVALQAPGRHLVGNALAALALAREAGADIRHAATGLGRYRGMRRRFEVRRGAGGGLLVSDYAHHPTELKAVLAAGREAFPGRRLVALFQPHQHSRTRCLLGAFAEALAGFDRILLADIYAARDSEADRSAVSSADLARRIQEAGGDVAAVGPVARCLESVLAAFDPASDLLLVLGAGDVEDVASPLLERI